MAGGTRKTPEGGRTTQAGLGWRHQQERARLLADLVPGTPCSACGQPMWPGEQSLDADHEQARALGGTQATRLLHASCNRRLGAQLGNRMRTGRPRPAPSARCWCGGSCFTHVPVSEL